MGVTSIEWTATISADGTVRPGYTFNPWFGCTKVAAGCTHCYAESFAKRYNKAAWGPNGTRVKTSEAYWRKPIKWNRDAVCIQSFDCANGTHSDACPQANRQRVFCASLADVFEDWQGPIVRADGRELWTAPEEPGRYVPWCDPTDMRDIEKQNIAEGRFRQATMDDLRADLFALIDATPNLDWLVLTKRPENVRRMWPMTTACATEFDAHEDSRKWPAYFRDIARLRSLAHHRRNVWLGTSISDQATADQNIPELLKLRDLCPVLFVSAEPLLGPVDVSQWLEDMDYDEDDHDCREERELVGAPATLDWLIIGGESGHGARPCNVAWIRALVAQCQAAGVPAFVKQVGSRPEGFGQDASRWADKLPYDAKGGDPGAWPIDLRVREFPGVVHA